LPKLLKAEQDREVDMKTYKVIRSIKSECYVQANSIPKAIEQAELDRCWEYAEEGDEEYQVETLPRKEKRNVRGKRSKGRKIKGVSRN